MWLAGWPPIAKPSSSVTGQSRTVADQAPLVDRLERAGVGEAGGILLFQRPLHVSSLSGLSRQGVSHTVPFEGSLNW